MADYMATARTNYFRVTDEERYQELYSRLYCKAEVIQDLTKEKNGVTLHGFAGYGSIEYKSRIPGGAEDEYEYCFSTFLQELQEILPDDEAFMYFEAGYEKLNYVQGIVYVCTSKTIDVMNMDDWALTRARQLLGENFTTETDY